MKNSGDWIDIVVARLDLPPAQVEHLSIYLSDEEQCRARRYHADRDRRRFIVARARARQLLAARTGQPPANIAMTYGIHGKPALAAHSNVHDWRFSLSHADDLAVYAFAHGRELGVDVEAVRALPDADAVAAHFFSPRENRLYAALCARHDPLAFWRCWTRKEALGKALGTGIIPPDAEIDRPVTSFCPARGFIAALVVA